MEGEQHLLVQAGTGTGKSLAYLVPSLLHRRAGRGRDRDPRAAAPAGRARPARGWSRRSRRPVRAASTRRTPSSRAAPTTPACTGSARACPTSRAPSTSCCPRARSARRCSSCAPGPRRRSRSKGSGERDNAPRHTDKEWRQVSVNHRECLGAAKCPFGQECFAERGQGEGAALPPDRHQPLAARDRRHRGRADDPRLRRRGDRRGPRAHRPGHPGGHRRAVGRRGRAGRPAQPAPRRRRPGRRPRRRRRRAARGDRRGAPGPLRPDPGGPRRRAGAGARRGPGLRLGVPQGRRTPTRRPTPAGPRPRARSRRSSRPPSGWPPTSTPTCSG